MLLKTLSRYDHIKNLYPSIGKFISAAVCKEELSRMKAWQVHSYGEELQCCSIRQPIITQPNQLLIQIEAASVNPLDIAMQNGYGRTFLNVLRYQDSPLPITLGRDFCGIIIDKGHGVSKNLNIGDRVYGMTPFYKDGSHAEITVADASNVCRVPENGLTYLEAASIPYAAMTAWSALWLFGGLAFKNIKGTKVLILGASGGVGTCAVQILKAHDAYVYATCSKSAVPLVKKCKADCVLAYTETDFSKNIESLGRFDIILDCANFGYDNIPPSWKYNSFITLNSPLLSDTDKYGLIGGFASCAAKIIPTNLKSIPQKKLVKWAYIIPCEEGMNLINGLVEKSQLLARIDSVYKFEDTLEAYKKLRRGHLRGKVVIDMLTKSSDVE